MYRTLRGFTSPDDQELFRGALLSEKVHQELGLLWILQT